MESHPYTLKNCDVAKLKWQQRQINRDRTCLFDPSGIHGDTEAYLNNGDARQIKTAPQIEAASHNEVSSYHKAALHSESAWLLYMY